MALSRAVSQLCSNSPQWDATMGCMHLSVFVLLFIDFFVCHAVFPTGGFSHSLGLESAVKHKLVSSKGECYLLMNTVQVQWLPPFKNTLNLRPCCCLHAVTALLCLLNSINIL